MAFLDQLLNLQEQLNKQRATFLTSLGISPQKPYASFYPEYETQTPQHQSPNPRILTQMGFRTNELVYACVQARSQAISEAEINVVYLDEEDKVVLPDHPLKKLLKRPTPGLSEQEFWQVVETYIGIAGFSAWEKEKNNKGEVIALWPLRPDWCAFLRGQRKPIAAIRYQPDGMDHVEIPIEDIVLFQYFDPMYPLLKGLSPTMVALDLIDTDNTSTKTVKRFLENGNFLGGVLKTEQVLTDSEADRIRQRWQDTHSGAENSGSIAVMGRGVDFTNTGQTFKEATFPELDARSEARICMVFRVPPMLIGAKIGVDRSTYSNYQEARKAFYESTISSEWKFLAGQLEEQLIGDFEKDTSKYSIEFNTDQISALQEDRTEQVNRAKTLWESGIGTLNESRAEAKLDPIFGEEGERRKDAQGQPGQAPDQGKPGQPGQPGTPPGQPGQPPSEPGEPIEPEDLGLDESGQQKPSGETEMETETEPGDVPANMEEDAQANKDMMASQDMPKKKVVGQRNSTDATQKAIEEVQAFRRFAKSRIKENKADLIGTYDFKYLTLAEQDLLIDGFRKDIEAKSIAQSLNDMVAMLRENAK